MIATSKFRWHYRTAGDPDLPPLLLLHGFTGCGAVWEEVMQQLQTEFYTIAVDCPGHGQTERISEGEPDSLSLELVSSELASLVKALGFPRVHLWGYSMGGRLALHFAVHQAAWCDHLILESTSPGIADSHERALRRTADESLAARIIADGVSAFVDTWAELPLFASQKRLPESKQQRLRDYRLQNSANGLAASLRGMGTGIQEPLHDAMSALDLPVLILTGAVDSKFCAIGDQIGDTICGSVRRSLPDVGHAPHWESPEACVRLVCPFLLGEQVPDSIDRPEVRKL